MSLATGARTDLPAAGRRFDAAPDVSGNAVRPAGRRGRTGIVESGAQAAGRAASVPAAATSCPTRPSASGPARPTRSSRTDGMGFFAGRFRRAAPIRGIPALRLGRRGRHRQRWRPGPARVPAGVAGVQVHLPPFPAGPAQRRGCDVPGAGGHLGGSPRVPACPGPLICASRTWRPPPSRTSEGVSARADACRPEEKRRSASEGRTAAPAAAIRPRSKPVHPAGSPRDVQQREGSGS
jgi:hypothetical protein